MTNTMDFLTWRGDLDFGTVPPCEVDCFIFSQLSTPDYTGIVGDLPVTLADASAAYFATHSESKSNLGVLQSSGVLPMLNFLATCPRYCGVTLSNYVNIVRTEASEQFSAVTLTLPGGDSVVSFRGTDDTIIGWKEDCNLAIMAEVSAQREAAKYLAGAVAGCKGGVSVVGHSKGGNLAVYAASRLPAEQRSRLLSVYSFDGPGFRAPFLQSEGYLSIADRVTTIMPQHSLVGTLMQFAGNRVIVRSDISGPYCHDGFHWEVSGPAFVRADMLSSFSRTYHEALCKVIDESDPETLRAFVDDLFRILLASGAGTITEFCRLKPQELLGIMRSLRHEKQVSSFTAELLESLVRAAL